MAEASGIVSFQIFGYMSMMLLLAVFFRSQFAFLQRLFIPSNILAGIMLLLLSPSILNIIHIPVGQLAEGFVFHLVTVLFIILGLRGFERDTPRESVAAATILMVKVKAVQAIIGSFIVLIIVFLLEPQFFAGLGSFLMMGFGFDAPIAQYFGGFWEEELAFAGGRYVSFSFVALGFLFAYILGLVMVVLGRKKSNQAATPDNADPTALAGIIYRKTSPSEQQEAGRLTTGNQSIDSFTLHLAIIGVVMLLTYGIMETVAEVIVTQFDPGAVIVAEVFLQMHYFLGFVLALLARKLIKFFNVDYLLNRETLNRTLGLSVDYMVVAAIVSVPLIISTEYIWQILIIAILGAVLTLLLVNWLSRALFGTSSLERKAVLFGFLTGNISSSVALLRVIDPKLESPVLRELTFAGVLSIIVGIPLLFIINLPLIGGGPIYIIYSIGLLLGYMLILFLFWYFITRRKMPEPEEIEDEEDEFPELKKKRGI